jgi:DNA polymerase epsilon subunit 1
MVGYLFNIKPYRITLESKKEMDCVLCFFSGEDGQLFKTLVVYEPYFYVKCRDDVMTEVHGALHRQLHGMVSKIDVCEKVDLDLTNHLSGITGKYIKLSFLNCNDLMSVRKMIKNKMSKKADIQDTWNIAAFQHQDYLSAIYDMREFDVIYYTRACIDLEIRCGLWYEVSFNPLTAELKRIPEKLTNPNLRILAFDIETTKLPLKFPDATKDHVMMISYVIDGDGFLIINRDIVAEDIEDFEYSPKEEF